MKKYYIGLLVIGLLTLGLIGYVITLGLQSKQDVQTEKSAQDIAKKLNDYVSQKQKIPASLSEAGVKDAPDTISYSKTSEKDYKFCITYKAAKGYGSSDITSTITNAAMSSAYGSSGASVYDDPSSNSYKPSTLYIDYTHKKGENCQTIQPYIYDYNSYYDNSGSSSSSVDQYCDPKGKYYEQYKMYCTQTTTTPRTTIQ